MSGPFFSIIIPTYNRENIIKRTVQSVKNQTFEKWELITSHIGRVTFVSNFYGKMPTNYLIYMTGHSSENLFLDYMGKSNKDIAMELTKYF